MGLGQPVEIFLSTASSNGIGIQPVPSHGGVLHGGTAMLNGASVLAFVAKLLGEADIGRLLAETEAAFERPSPLLVLPYLVGERTPHDDPYAQGVVFGLSASTRRTDVVQAALKGVAFTFADALPALGAAGARLGVIGFIGGGARSHFWGRIIASVLEGPLHRYVGGETGPAFGAARLARLALGRDATSTVVVEPAIADVIEPDATLAEAYLPRMAAFRRVYAALRQEFETRPLTEPQRSA
jgi:xylulokinase